MERIDIAKSYASAEARFSGFEGTEKKNLKQQLATTLAARVPDQANEILISYNAQPAEGKKLVQQLIALQSKYGEDALKKLIEIHPDKDIVEYYHTPAKEEKSNCGACSGADGKTCHMMQMQQTSSADGIMQKTIAGSTVKEWLPFAIASTLFIGSIIIFSVEYSKTK